MMQRDDATLRQIEAARPNASTWLSANAGSGKTRVLTDRVARLLLEHVEPQHILCLTYTKAAASEMQNRLFKRLGDWAMLADDDLRAALDDLGVSGPRDDAALRAARRLFARAIEAPGGLKIQTIHSFCAALLRRFPLEAQVSPQFTEMDDLSITILQKDILEEIASGPEAEVFEALALQFTSDEMDKLTGDIVRHRDAFAAPMTHAEAHALLGLPDDANFETLKAQVFLGGEAQMLARLAEVCATGSKTDMALAQKLRALTSLGLDALPALEECFLTKSGANPYTAKLGKIPTKATQKHIPDLLDALDGFMLRIEAARQTRLGLMAAAQTLVLNRFAQVFLPRYERAKQLRGWLDFDDLIVKARDLLIDPRVAEWVLYRLDGGIDHILVDEAQDTSPIQWQVIERLAQEFTAGIGSRADIPRTIFVVGDRKQSIYSFQGADPREFDRMQAEFADRLDATNTPLNTLELEYSFRSSRAILDVVDAAFEGHSTAGFTSENPHLAFKDAMPGRVDLWPLVEPAPKEEEGDWHRPVDQLGQSHHTVILARRIAAEISRMLDHKTPIPVEQGRNGTYAMRPVRAGDFLILVQSRGALFEAIIRECKALSLPMAGADRLKVGGEMAVRDLKALLSFLALPEDDLSLATVLKSPLGGWDEAALFDLAQGRGKGPLWPILRKQDKTHPQLLAMLRDLSARTDFLRPYDLLERILTRWDGRKKLLARLGDEAQDGIDALLSQALAYERSAVPSLTGFLTWMESDNLEIKRQMESAGDRIRVMTVHGSKGLEAPIVILPETIKKDRAIDAKVFETGGRAVWSPAVSAAPDAILALRTDLTEAQQAEKERLLYVAMTRAEKWLIVAGAGAMQAQNAKWYVMAESALKACDAAEHDFGFGVGLRLEYGDWAGTETFPEAASIPSPSITLPAFFAEAAARPLPLPTTLSPSDLGGAKALPSEDGLDEEAAKRRGRQVHTLLEHLPSLPRNDWPVMAHRLLNAGGESVTEAEATPLLEEACRVLDAPRLAPVFAATTLAEVPVTADLPALGGQRIHGVIDRLIVSPDRVMAVDFKTNIAVPQNPAQCPEGLLRQMGAYQAALAQIYPDREIVTALLWTRSAELMILPHDIVINALTRTQIS
ncbi:double-strand break repair helicase AddA [Rhodobacterales bacterium 59_46_T64]|nr:double-strand break repair helicase AddA [Rhodobacterales bacterium 59_46_T64]